MGFDPLFRRARPSKLHMLPRGASFVFVKKRGNDEFTRVPS